ncbi:hypothetical protein [Tateyamaria sp.]|uniref:hypothetical protein n=1 Tax=Tateyamaria sp. TaxID=1929288 RepID=UPI003B2243D9
MSGKYGRQSYLNDVLAASSSTHSAKHVLHVMFCRSEFDRPEVTIKKRQIAKDTGLRRESIRLALRFLEAEGTIAIISGGRGGRSVPVTYKLLIAKGTNNRAKGTNNRAKGTNNWAKGTNNWAKGTNNWAPPLYSLNSFTADAARQTKSSAAGRDESWQKSAGHNTGGGEGIRWNFAEKQQNGTWRARSPEEMMQDPLFALAYELTGYYGTAKELFAKWVSGKKPVGEI